MVALCWDLSSSAGLRLNFVKIQIWQLEKLTKILIIWAKSHEFVLLIYFNKVIKKTSKSCWQLKNVLKKSFLNVKFPQKLSPSFLISAVKSFLKKYYLSHTKNAKDNWYIFM